MQIRKAIRTDVPSISQLVSYLSEKYIVGELSQEGREKLLGSMTPEAITQYINEGYRYHVADTEQGIVGVVAVKENQHLYHLFVAETYQKRGIAKILWQTAMKECLANGNPGKFTVNSSTYALPIYERLGFEAQSSPITKNGIVFIPMRLDIKNPNKI